MKELSTEEMNSVRGGEVNICAPGFSLSINEAIGIGVNVAPVVEENIAVLSAGALQSNTADVVQSIIQNVGNIIQRP